MMHADAILLRGGHTSQATSIDNFTFRSSSCHSFSRAALTAAQEQPHTVSQSHAKATTALFGRHQDGRRSQLDGAAHANNGQGSSFVSMDADAIRFAKSDKRPPAIKTKAQGQDGDGKLVKQAMLGSFAAARQSGGVTLRS
jgi:hypothetical protein